MFERFSCLHFGKVSNMHLKYNSFYLALFITTSNVFADFMAINWSISTDRGFSHIERDYNYPMYREVAPAPCDLTTSCDAFCCQDPDCGKNEISECVKPSHSCSESLSFFDCGCDNSDKPQWLSLFCYVFKNPIYLGKFFRTPRKIEKFATLKNIILKKAAFFRNRNNDGLKTKLASQLGAPILTFVPMSTSFPAVNTLLRKIPLKDSTFACSSGPVKHRINGTAVCLTQITQELCENGHALSVIPYLVQSSNVSAYSSVPVVLRDSDFLKGLVTDVAIKCVELKLKTIWFKKRNMEIFQEHSIRDCPDSNSAYRTFLKNNTCKNILAYVQYRFTVNGSDVVKVKVEYGLTDVPIPVENNTFSDNIIHKYIYLKQKFNVHFFDIMHKPNDNRNYSASDDILNRGYFVGEELNFGYKRITNSSTSWERGTMAVFGNGDSCDSSSPITFGYDTFSLCHIRRLYSNCTQLRSATEEIFENLLKGDNLAPYANLRPPYNSSIPLLRNYRNYSHEVSGSRTKCWVPVGQEILIQYTSIPTDSGRLVHRIVGVRVDRLYQNVSADTDVRLTARVSYFFVSSSKGKPLSKFWMRMYSRERSENSWLNILNGFDDVDPGEREEMTFWCTGLAVSAAVAIASSKVDFHLGGESYTEGVFQALLQKRLTLKWERKTRKILSVSPTQTPPKISPLNETSEKIIEMMSLRRRNAERYGEWDNIGNEVQRFDF